MREFKNETGEVWHAKAIDHMVAHGKPGAAMVFVPADDPDAEPLRSHVTFNSTAAADLTLGTLGDKELRRRLKVAQAEAMG